MLPPTWHTWALDELPPGYRAGTTSGMGSAGDLWAVLATSPDCTSSKPRRPRPAAAQHISSVVRCDCRPCTDNAPGVASAIAAPEQIRRSLEIRMRPGDRKVTDGDTTTYEKVAPVPLDVTNLPPVYGIRRLLTVIRRTNPGFFDHRGPQLNESNPLAGWSRTAVDRMLEAGLGTADPLGHERATGRFTLRAMGRLPHPAPAPGPGTSWVFWPSDDLDGALSLTDPRPGWGEQKDPSHWRTFDTTGAGTALLLHATCVHTLPDGVHVVLVDTRDAALLPDCAAYAAAHAEDTMQTLTTLWRLLADTPGGPDAAELADAWRIAAA